MQIDVNELQKEILLKTLRWLMKDFKPREEKGHQEKEAVENLIHKISKD